MLTKFQKKNNSLKTFLIYFFYIKIFCNAWEHNAMHIYKIKWRWKLS